MSKDWNEQALEYVLIGLPGAAFAVSTWWPDTWPFLAVSAVVASLPVALGALRGLLDRHMVGDQFNLVALTLCFAVSAWQTAAIIVILLGLGRVIERYADAVADRDIQTYVEKKPTQAKRERHGGTDLVPIERVAVGDALVVAQGERVPVDGVVVQGAAHLDEASVAGETSMREKVMGDAVMASTLMRAGMVKIRAVRTDQKSVVERSLSIVSAAERQPSDKERLAERLSGLTMLLLGLAGFALWIFRHDVHGMIAFFLLAGSEGLESSIKRLTRAMLARCLLQGAVVKNGRAFETIATLDTLAIDKASLLTFADMHVGRLEHDPHVSDALVWECTAVAEKNSEHPVGRALFRHAAKYIGSVPDPEEFHVYPSKGVRAILQGREVVVGTAELLRGRNISFDGAWLAGSTSPIEGTGTDVFIALDGSCIGRVRLQDRPRMEIRDHLEHVRELGVRKQLLFTGDTIRVAGTVATAIGITDFRPTMTTEDTCREVGRLAQGGTVAYVGSGTRDVPALVRANIGMVFGNGGRGLHVESAGTVLMSDDLGRVPDLIRLSRRARFLVRADLLAWAVTNTIGIALALFGFGPSFIALFGLGVKRLPLLFSFRLVLSHQPDGQSAQLARK